MRACQPKDLKGRERRSAWERGREREGERERVHARRRGRERKRFGFSFYMFSSTWACPVQIGLSRGMLFVLPEVFTLVLGPSFDLPCFLATAILDSVSLFYLPNISPSRDGRPNSLGIGSSRSFWLLPAELGWRGVLVLPFLLVSSFRVLIAVSI